MNRIGARKGVWKTAGAVVVITLLGSALAIAATARPRGGHERGDPRIFERLDLSDDTRAALEAVWSRARAAAEPLREELRTERQALDELLDASEIDETAVFEQLERVGAARAALDRRRVASRIETHALLSEDERAAFRAAKEERRERRQRRIERFRERHGSTDGFGAPGVWSDEDLLGSLEPAW